MSFVHLRNYTEYSFAEGVMKPKALAERAAELGMPAVALTDTGGLFGAIEFYKACGEAGVKPIMGLEVEVSLSDAPGTAAGEAVVLLAEDVVGWENLVKISSTCCRGGAARPTAIGLPCLADWSGGLIGLLCTAAGKTRESAVALADVFGKDQMFLEAENHGLPHEQSLVGEVSGLGRDLGIPVVAANNCRFLSKDDAEAYRIVRSIRTGKASRQDSHGQETVTNGCWDGFHMKSSGEMERLWQDLPEALSNTVQISERCRVVLDRDPVWPPVDVPDGFSSPRHYLRHLCETGLQQKCKQAEPRYADRLRRELELIEARGWVDYFLFVHNYVRTAEGMGLMTTDRGSACGSLTNYALGITTTDPLEYGLLFERFLNPSRAVWPDIDIDVTSGGQRSVLDSLIRRHGGDCVARVGSTYRISEEEAARRVAEEAGRTATDSHRFVYEFLTDPDQEPSDAEERLLFKATRMLAGTPTHVSTHPCGFVVTPSDLGGFAPTCGVGSGGPPVLQFDWAIEELGLVKFDLIGSKALSMVQSTVALVKQRREEDIDFQQIPEDDAKTFELLRSGRTVGVFQFGSKGMRESLVEVQPESIVDLAAIVALFRPHTKDLLHSFAKRKRGAEPTESVHPLFDAAVEDTFGIFAFQEQMMEIGHRMGGLTLAETDDLRKAIMKRIPQRTVELRKTFVEGAMRQGVGEEVAKAAYAELETMGRHTFNKAHAVTYVRFSYRTAFLKAHYPLELTTAFLNTYREEKRLCAALIEEARGIDTEILRPDVNASETECIVQDDAVRLGLSTIKHCSSSIVEATIDERNTSGPFRDIFDCASRLAPAGLDRRTLTSLIASGALDSLPGTPAQMFAATDLALDVARRVAAGERASELDTSLPQNVDSFDLVKEIAAIHGGRIRDLSFDIYCPKTYAHHLRLTMWLPPETVIFDLDAQRLVEHARSFVGGLEADRNEEYAIGLNSRVDQYSDHHLLMLDFDSVDDGAIERLRERGGYLLKSGRGYHFIGKTLIPSQEQWAAALRAIQETPELRDHIDDSHIGMSLKRGYSTLRVLESPAKPQRPMMIRVL